MLELPITSCSAALAAVLLTGLSLNVSRLRMRHRISLGSGGHKALQLAVRAHGNALEQSLLFFLLLLIAEAQAHSLRRWPLWQVLSCWRVGPMPSACWPGS